jgi:hypothetical protein
MIIKGGRRGGAKQLTNHLLRRDTNEEVQVCEIEGYPAAQPDDNSLRHALRLMETQAKAKGKSRTLYHAIIALQQGENRSKTDARIALDGNPVEYDRAIKIP